MTQDGVLQIAAAELLVLACLSLVVVVGLKPATGRGVLMWSAITAATFVAAGLGLELYQGQAMSVSAPIFAMLLMTGLLAVLASAVRAVVDRIAGARTRTRG